MAPVDVIIVIVLVFAVAGGLSQGFFRSFCSLAGLVLGLILAAWNYPAAAEIVLPFIRVGAIANCVGFLAIALLVMAVAAAEATVGLAIVIAIYRNRRTPLVDEYASMRE